MKREYYLDLAAAGHRMPIGTDLVLHERDDPESVLYDGVQLGKVVEEAARRYETPLAVPMMDLMIEKTLLLEMIGIPAAQIPTYHFSEAPGPDVFAAVECGVDGPPNARMRAHTEAVRYIAEHTDLLPIGMAIGPFSLMTKLVADPITPVFMAGTGVTADEDPELRTVEAALDLSIEVILFSLKAQLAAGAKAIMIAEPAANKVYFSPKQVGAGPGTFDRYAVAYNRRIKDLLDEAGADLLFHDCGELTDDMVRKFGVLDPAILSLGSSRVLWEDAALVSKTTVLYGNLPTKRFYSDDLISVDGVRALAGEITERMRVSGHPFILGSECDVLSVPGCHETICEKVAAFVEHG